jgi:septal ring-binding cell division protein DamX
LTQIRPHRQFGEDNQIRGPQWLAEQAELGYVIHLATASDRQGLFAIADRYAHQLPGRLSYLPLKGQSSQGFALLYGPFASQAEAAMALSSLPRFIQQQSPQLRTMGEVKGHLGKDQARINPAAI